MLEAACVWATAFFDGKNVFFLVVVVLVGFGPLLGRSWALLGRSWPLLGGSWALLAGPWGTKIDFPVVLVAKINFSKNIEKH